MYGLSAGMKKGGRCREVADSGGSTENNFDKQVAFVTYLDG